MGKFGSNYVPATHNVELKSSRAEESKEWLLDSGVSHHLIESLQILANFVSLDYGERVIMGNGSQLPFKHVGFSVLLLDKHKILLHDILHVS